MDNKLLTQLEIVVLGYMYFYKIGKPKILDKEYDIIFKTLPENSKVRDILWEDINEEYISYVFDNKKLPEKSPLPSSLEPKKDEIVFGSIKETPYSRINVINKCNFPEPKSIQMMNTWEDIEKLYLPQIPEEEEMIMSLKLDGWSIMLDYIPEPEFVQMGGIVEYQDTDFRYARTRGRNTKETDVTDIIYKIAPKIRVDKPIRIAVELILIKEGLNIINSKGYNYSNPRNTIAAFISGTLNVEDYKDYVKPMALNIICEQGTPYFDKQSDTFSQLKEWGFLIPSFIIFKKQEIKNAFSTIENHYISNLQSLILVDGIVCSTNCKNTAKDITNTLYGNYNSGLIAIKMGNVWGKTALVSRIKRFYSSAGSANHSIMAEIEPVKSNIGNIITNVPLTNVRTIIKNSLRVGDLIEITYHSDQIVHFERKV